MANHPVDVPILTDEAHTPNIPTTITDELPLTEQPDVRRTRAIQVEKEMLATLSVTRMLSVSEVADKMGPEWDADRVKLYLRKPDVKVLVEEAREQANQMAAMALTRLHAALPRTVDALLTIAGDDKHPRQADMIREHLKYTVAPLVDRANKADDDNLHINITVAAEVGSLMKEAMIGFAKERRFEGARTVEDDPHVRTGTAATQEAQFRSAATEEDTAPTGAAGD